MVLRVILMVDVGSAIETTDMTNETLYGRGQGIRND